MTSFACAFAVSLAVSCGGGHAPPGPSPLETVVQDDAELLYRPPARLDADLRTLRALGVDRVRLNANWGALAPARRGPGFRPTDSRTYPQAQWRLLDRAVEASHRAGLKVMIDVGFFAPRWAVRRYGSSARPRYEPSAAAFGAFARALAARYDGDGHPAVRLWTTWNEPNNFSFLLPQWVRAGGRWVPRSPGVYRAMHEAAYASLKDVNGSNRVLVGALAPRGRARPGPAASISPLRFLRELACVDARLRPLRAPRCAGFRPIRADGFSIHPYSFGGPPEASDPSPDDVPIADLDRLSGLLAALAARGRIAGPLPAYDTEYGYETLPPDPTRGVSPARQAGYLTRAAYLAWRRPDVRMQAQFLLRDLPRRPGPRPWVDYQSGLYDVRGRPKPATLTFPFPFVARPALDGAGTRGLYVFGQVRPGRGARGIAIERGAAAHWHRVAPSGIAAYPLDGPSTFETDAHGFFEGFIPGAGPGLYRAVAGSLVASAPFAAQGPARRLADLARYR